MNEKIIYDCIVIGSGPAGLTAAIYNARADVKTVVIEGNQPGGQLTITPMVDNYPGFPGGVGGFKLMMDMRAQVKNFGVEIRQGMVGKIKKNNELFEIELEDGEKLETKTVIVATGAAVKWLGLEKEKELIGHGVSSCATCDGMFFRDKTVAIVGGGDTACEDAAFLSKITKKTYLIHRREALKASVAEQKKVLDNPKVEICWNCEVKELNPPTPTDVGAPSLENGGLQNLKTIKVVNNKTGEEKIIETDGLFVAIGYAPATKFLEGLIKLKEGGQVVVGENQKYSMMTNVEGIFAAGDCVNENHRQAIIAAGDGSRAALEAQSWINKSVS